MNFLGHCLFSEANSAALAGSLWPDFSRRPTNTKCSPNFLLHFDRHQWIDKTTDHSPILAPLRQALRPVFLKTSPIVVDMILDHHLANHWSNYCSTSLDTFAQRTYRLLFDFDELPKPERLDKTLYWMHKNNWFVGYQTPEGITRALEGISQRIRFNNPIVKNTGIAITMTHQFEAELSHFIHHLQKNLPLIKAAD